MKKDRISKRGIKNEGRPLKEINEKQVHDLAAINCSIAEMAAVLDCDESTLTRRFAQVIEKGREHGTMSLKRMQYKLAMDGDRTMLIWLGKIMLGQREKTEVLNIHKMDAEGLPEVQLAAQHLKDAAISSTEFSSPQISDTRSL